MFKVILVLILIVFVSLFAKKNVLENAVDQIPTRFCRPTRFFSPYDYRGTVDVTQSPVPLVFGQSEAVGENASYCYDQVTQRWD